MSLKINFAKTKLIAFNQPIEKTLTTLNVLHLENVYDFKYLGSWIIATENNPGSRMESTQQDD